MNVGIANTAKFLLSGSYRPPVSGLLTKYLVVIFHGVSADALGMIALGDHWVSRLPDAAFFAPNAPFPFDMGSQGFQWFSLKNRTPESDIAGLRTVSGTVHKLLDDALTKLGLDDSALALVGFSQGGMIALHVALRRERIPAAAVCISGALGARNHLPKELTVKPPVLLTHGTTDTVVPIDNMYEAKATLEGVGVSVQTLVRPDLDHRFDTETIDGVGEFLERSFCTSSIRREQ